MDFLDLAKSRYSVRKFKSDKVEKEKLDAVLEAGRIAPTAANFQPQRILVVQSSEGMEKVRECTRFHFHAPVVLVICYDKDVCWKHGQTGKPSGEVDASIVCDHMMLEAASLGLGSTWVGGFDHLKVRSLFDLPENLEPVALLPMGYPADEAAPHPAHYKRFPLEHSVFYESFD